MMCPSLFYIPLGVPCKYRLAFFLNAFYACPNIVLLGNSWDIFVVGGLPHLAIVCQSVSPCVMHLLPDACVNHPEISRVFLQTSRPSLGKCGKG